MLRVRRIVVIGAVVLVFGVALSACGSDGGSDDGGASGAADSSARDTFVLDEWSVAAPTEPIHAGEVRITAVNDGSETHELVIVRTADAASLPTKADGSVDEEAISEADKPGEIPDVAAGDSAAATLDLPAGDYVAFCNLVDQMGNGGSGMGSGSSMGGGNGMGGGGMGGGGMGHVHFQLGMSVAFTVT
jgi:hypothetical protein